MTEHRFIKVAWAGPESIAEAEKALAAGSPVSIGLPPEVSHAMYSRLFPDAPPGAPERVNKKGDAHLIEQVATIASLEALRELIPIVQEKHLSVAAISPPPTLLLSPYEEDLTQTGAGTQLPGAVF